MKTKFERSQQELLAAPRTLRVLVREVGGNYIAALQSEVAHVEQAVHATKEARRQQTQLRGMLKAIQELKIKPEKARRRDLKALDKLVTKLSDTAENL